MTRRARVYTEMVTTGALIHGDSQRHLQFNDEEHPVALQLGGSSPKELAIAAKMGADFGYDEINLNCGCPSDRVQNGAFGACLMREPLLVRDCVSAMNDAVVTSAKMVSDATSASFTHNCLDTFQCIGFELRCAAIVVNLSCCFICSTCPLFSWLANSSV